ncbi:hypothetical protein E0485_09580 [Paenibacillus albiflavus]|uniref:LiaF transmembrane domain-containing protein n=1 Tax=Paenibacillus albiflavus TaxID=2545760 RepID=A0A4V6P6C3_9BACL|nr:hypothetical protein [Paenibacillus albiflavus]TCZ77722.1 hypothetical protein E0485_09580 [Paenibacillus albiflavus]
MRASRNTGVAVALIALGAIILLSRTGFFFGPVMGFILPIIMLGLGYYGIKNGSKFGWVIAILGGIILFAKLTPLFIMILAVAMVVFGISMLGKKSQV